MKFWIGFFLFIVGSVVSALGFMLNSNTPIQVGPVPVLGGAAVALIGLIMWVSSR